MQKTAILMAANQNYDFALANAAMSLKDFNFKWSSDLYVMHDIDEATRDKISKIWCDETHRIFWKKYDYEDFRKDCDFELDKVAKFKRYSHFIFCKFYLFDLLKQGYDRVMWFDCDVLFRDDILQTMQVAKYKDIRGFIASHNPDVNKDLMQFYFDAKKLDFLSGKFVYVSGQFIWLEKSILDKIQDGKKECFEILFLLLKHYNSLSRSDEIPFNILINKYDLDYEDLPIRIPPFSDTSHSMIAINPIDHLKFNSPLFLLLYHDWMANHKKWLLQYNNEDRLEPRKSLLPINSSSDAYRFLVGLEFYSRYEKSIQNMFVENFTDYYFYPRFYSKAQNIDFYSPYIKGFFRLQTKVHYRKPLRFKFYWSNLGRKPNAKQFEKLQKINPNISLIASHIDYALDFNKGFGYDDVNYITSHFKNFIQLLLPLYASKKYSSQQFSAKDRIKSHLAYKLGQAIIENSKSLKGYIRMPYVLSYIKDKHKQDQKIYEEKIKENPNLKLPPLETYKDYEEALKLKECLSYKLGLALMRASNNAWGGGGYVKFVFEAFSLKRAFLKNKDKKNELRN